MAYKESVAEILIRVSNLKTKKEKIEALRASHNIVLENIVDLCFNPNLKFALPPGEPPYKAATK